MPKDLDISTRFEKWHPGFIDDKEFKEKFQSIIYELLESEI
jgi:hypothetical protein